MTLKNNQIDATYCVEELNQIWLTRAELAARWKMPLTTLAHWAHRKQGPGYSIFGKHARYRLADVIAWERQAGRGGSGETPG